MTIGYNDYIEKYIINFNNANLPGEHHFVSIFLFPMILQMSGLTPIYINPDGTKKLPGDLIYFDNKLTIEVKFDNISFTKTQWEVWFKNKTKDTILDKNTCPKYFIGIFKKGILIQEWKDVIYYFKKMIEKRNKINSDDLILNPYTPNYKLSSYYSEYENEMINDYFPYEKDKLKRNELENRFKNKMNEILIKEKCLTIAST